MSSKNKKLNCHNAHVQMHFQKKFKNLHSHLTLQELARNPKNPSYEQLVVKEG